MAHSAESKRQSIEARLRNEAGSSQYLPRERRRYATGILLKRLAHQTDRWTLKGAYLLETRLEIEGVGVSSFTKDVDLATENTVDLLEDLRTSAGLSDIDPFEIRLYSRPRPSPKTERLDVELWLAGALFERFQVDIAELARREESEPFVLVANPIESQKIHIKVQTLSGALVDKLCAFSTTHVDDRPSSRTRDLPDMLHLIELAGDQAAQLVTETLQRLRWQIPNEFPPLPEDWPPKLFDRTGKKLDTAEVHKKLEVFWTPILTAVRGEVRG